MNTNQAGITTLDPLARHDSQYLVFRLDGQDYGIPILQVQEIREWSRATTLPNTPDYILGVLSLRGTIVPVVDLRQRFRLSPAKPDTFTAIVVVNVNGRLAGVVVDSVSDVARFEPEQRRPLPDFEGHANRQFIDGLMQGEGKMIIVLNMERLLSADDFNVGGGLSQQAV